MPTDIPHARRDEILRRLTAGRAVVASALAVEFGISEDAIRRDLRALAAEGRCRRVYGGALPLNEVCKSAAARIDEASAREEALIRTGVGTIRRGEFVFLDSGSTNLAMVAHLPEDYGLTMATNSIGIASEILRRADLTLIMVGGSVEPQMGGCIDATAIQALAGMNIDRCFLSACAVSTKTGLGATHFGDAQFKRALIAASQHCIVLTTTEQLGNGAPHRVTPLSAIEHLVVEAGIKEETLGILRSVGVSVLIARASV